MICKELLNSMRGHPPPKLGRGDRWKAVVCCAATLIASPGALQETYRIFFLKGKILKIKLLTFEKARAALKEPWSVLI